MPVLRVPYFIQPDNASCQATVLKMMSAYIDRKRGQPVQNRVIKDIKTSVNGDARRPNKVDQNAWANFHWWLQNEYCDMRFSMDTTNDIAKAITIIRNSIDNNWPVLVSTNRNMSSSGHIILVVGVMRLEGSRLHEPIPGPVGQNLAFICHDPYGRFGAMFFTSDPRWGKGRYDMPGGYSAPGGEVGPGMCVCYSLEGIGTSGGTFLLIRAN
jgi:hypothetical protein